MNVPFPVPYYSSNPPINFQEFEGKYSYQVWRFKMKLLNQFTIPKKNFRDIDFVKKDKFDYWKNECKEHPTSQHCLVYCD